MKTHTRKVGHQLFNDNPSGRHSKVKAGYGSAEKARRTLKQLRGKPAAYQRQVATTMFYRAKYHKYRTKDMEAAMNVYGKFLKKLNPTAA
jgi:hypothetical protein